MAKEKEETTEDEERVKAIRINSKDPVMMAMFMLQDNPDIIRCQENLYSFNGKCYDILEDKVLDEMYLSFCIKYGVTMQFSRINIVIRAFLVYPVISKVDKMNDYESLICLNNGILNIHTKEFQPHSKDFYFDSYINVDYNKEATACPDFLKYLNHTFNNDQQTVTNIIRLGGYLMDTSCAAERMFIFDGSGSNGKSILINTFRLFFDHSQLSPLSLDALASNTFSKELLLKSRVNFAAEQKKTNLDSEEIKKIITGDMMEITRKYKLSLCFIPKTKIIVACNGLPRFNDTTHAIYRRMIIVRFPNQYLEQWEYDKLANPASCNAFPKDNDLFDKIKNEKSAILNLFIEGLIDLRKNKYKFIESEDSVMAMNEFKRDSDTVRVFLEDNYEISDGIKTTSLRSIFQHYREWYHYNVQDSGAVKFRINELGKRLKDIFSVDCVGREYVYNNDTGRSERETMYPLSLISESITTGIPVTEEKAKQIGINFGDK
jgi:P4 family phage/plasmid primase-like protien